MLSFRAALLLRLLLLLLCGTAFFTTDASARPAGKRAGLSRYMTAPAALVGAPEGLVNANAGWQVRAERPRAHRRIRIRTASAEPLAGRAATSAGGLVDEARRWIGANPTGRSSLWCATFMNFVLERSGRKGSGSNMASSFASYGTRISGPQVGAIAVMSRGRGGGHVGIVSGIDANGNPIIISGNHGHRVAEAAYPRGRVYAYVMP